MSLESPQTGSKSVTAKGWSELTGSAKSCFPTGNPDLLPTVGDMPLQGLHTPTDFSVIRVGASNNRN